jgi:branched-chain amino acid transport system substrate-binding protein
MKVIEALEAGLTLSLPSGSVSLDPATHHCVLDIYLGQYQGGQLKVLTPFAAQPPADTAAVCDLVANPNDNQQYVISVG